MFLLLKVAFDEALAPSIDGIMNRLYQSGTEDETILVGRGLIF